MKLLDYKECAVSLPSFRVYHLLQSAVPEEETLRRKPPAAGGGLLRGRVMMSSCQPPFRSVTPFHGHHIATEAKSCSPQVVHARKCESGQH